MSLKTPFSLSKWYFDGVSEEGSAIIAYSARLHWKSITVPYTSYLYLPANGPARVKSRFRGVVEPETGPDGIRWQEPHFTLEGEWQAAAAPLQARLHDSSAGYLDWHCLQPVSKCHIRLGKEPPIKGWGYVERLEMTLPPWALNFDELRWGRFAHPETPLVWIELKGQTTRRWVFDGQTLVQDAAISDQGIDMPLLGKRLLLEQPVVIEQLEKFREVMGGLLRWLPGFERFTPLKFLNARESKWRSAGTLLHNGAVRSTGWVIHE